MISWFSLQLILFFKISCTTRIRFGDHKSMMPWSVLSGWAMPGLRLVDISPLPSYLLALIWKCLVGLLHADNRSLTDVEQSEKYCCLKWSKVATVCWTGVDIKNKRQVCREPPTSWAGLKKTSRGVPKLCLEKARGQWLLGLWLGQVI